MHSFYSDNTVNVTVIIIYMECKKNYIILRMLHYISLVHDMTPCVCVSFVTSRSFEAADPSDVL